MEGVLSNPSSRLRSPQYKYHDLKSWTSVPGKSFSIVYGSKESTKDQKVTLDTPLGDDMCNLMRDYAEELVRKKKEKAAKKKARK